METGLMAGVTALLHWLALPQVGLSAVFVIAFVSATLLPLGSEPAVFALVETQPELFWPAMGVATLGNTLGGVVTWWMGWGARGAADRLRREGSGSANLRATAEPSKARQYAMAWLQKHGAVACLLSWLPIVGDPLCAVAGWLRLPFWPCALYMAIGKFARYVSMTAFLIWLI